MAVNRRLAQIDQHDFQPRRQVLLQDIEFTQIDTHRKYADHLARFWPEAIQEQAASPPRTVGELTDRFAAKHGHGLRRETVSKALNGLLDDGLVNCQPTGKGKPNLWSRNDKSDP